MKKRRFMKNEDAALRKMLPRYTKIAIRIAKEAGAILLKHFGNLYDVQNKGEAGDLVTEADKASEALILRRLHEHLPEHSVIAEESGQHMMASHEFLWAVDPLDGTTNYAHQFPVFAVSLALLYRNDPVVGVIYNPASKEMFHAQKNGGAYLNRKEIRVSSVANLADSLLVTGFAYNRRHTSDTNYPEFCHLTDLTQGVRRVGAAALDLTNVACGRVDGYWEKGIKVWDIAAGSLLVTEAGGKVAELDGSPIDFFFGRILATNGILHHELIKELRICHDKKNRA